MKNVQLITESLIAGNIDEVKTLVQKEIDAGTNPNDILQKGLIPGMDTVGEMMERGDLFIPEVLMASQAMNGSVEILKPLLSEDEASSAGKVLIGTVKGDLHDIGKNLVIMMMESAGFEVIDLGVDVDPDKFVEAIKTNNPDILGLSALLTTTMEMMRNSIDSIKEAGLRDSLKIIVGGAPVTENYANEIGADGYAPDAGSACKIAKALCA